MDAEKVYKGMPDDPIGCHNKFIEMRNKYYAHDENDFKAAQLGAVLNVDEDKMVGIAYPRSHTKFDYDATISILRRLCQRTKEWVSTKLDKERERVSSYVAQRGYNVLNGYNDMRIRGV